MTTRETVVWETRVNVCQQLPSEIVPEHQQSDLDAAEQSQGTRPCCRMGFRNGVDQFTRVKDLVTVKACGSIRGSGLSFS